MGFLSAGMAARLFMACGGLGGFVSLVSFLSAGATAVDDCGGGRRSERPRRERRVVRRVAPAVVRPVVSAVVDPVVRPAVSAVVGPVVEPIAEPAAVVPIVRRPFSLIRARDMVANWGTGSCAWATAVALLNEAGHQPMGEWVRRNRNSPPRGTSFEEVVETLNGYGYSMRVLRDVGDVFACVRAGKPVGYICEVPGGLHARALVAYDLDARTAAYVDCNDPAMLTTVSLDEWLRQWSTGSGTGMVVDRRAARTKIADTGPRAGWCDLAKFAAGGE